MSEIDIQAMRDWGKGTTYQPKGQEHIPEPAPPILFKVPPQEDLWGTYWVFDEPGMDDIMTQAGDCLDADLERLNVKPVKAKNEDDKLFLARYEFPGYQKNYTHEDGIVSGQDKSTVMGFVDFLCGFPYGDIELMIAIGAWSSTVAEIDALSAPDAASPPVPNEFFQEKVADRMLSNYMYLPKDNVELLAKNLNGTTETKNPHWWTRWNIIKKEAKFPIPGEMMFLGMRLFPTSPWGNQSTSPFVFSGNFMDTLYYTSGKITAIEEPTDDRPYSLYTVKWRKDSVKAKPSDFAQYTVGDRVAILKKPADDTTSQTWDKNNKFDQDNWIIIPVTFYEVEDQ
jgi:hypothetical protein